MGDRDLQLDQRIWGPAAPSIDAARVPWSNSPVTLAEQLENLPVAFMAKLVERGFSQDQLLRWASMMGDDRDARNRLTGDIAAPTDGDISDAPQPTDPSYDELRELGLSAMRQGELAVCVLAGGMATRMGGVVKALVEALPGQTFLDLRLAERAAVERICGRAHPLWLMTSFATDDGIRRALSSAVTSKTPQGIEVFEQCVSLRLDPTSRGLFLDDSGEPSIYATGHGDLLDALRRSGVLQRFVDHGGRYLWVENLDNLGATVDPAILGFHMQHGGPVTVELVDKVAGDKGGGPIRHNGRPIITELFRLPENFDADAIPVFNTNTFIIDAPKLLAVPFEFTYVEVHKSVGERTAVQFERLFGEITSALEPRFLRVPRDGEASRFLPVKDADELVRRRGEIERIVATRF